MWHYCLYDETSCPSLPRRNPTEADDSVILGCMTMAGWPCTSVLFGQTNYRLNHPEDLTAKNYRWPNIVVRPASSRRIIFVAVSHIALQCLLHCFSSALFPPMCCLTHCAQRRNVRSRLGIKGTTAKDCCVSMTCPCLGLAQMEHEVRDWQIHPDGYLRRPQMAYAAPETAMPPLPHPLVQSPQSLAQISEKPEPVDALAPAAQQMTRIERRRTIM